MVDRQEKLERNKSGTLRGRAPRSRAQKSPQKKSADERVKFITDHAQLFVWLEPQLLQAKPRVTAARFFVDEALDVVDCFKLDGQRSVDQWNFHYFLHGLFEQAFDDEVECSSALLWFWSQFYATAVVLDGVPCSLETANQMAISAVHLEPRLICIREGVIRSTKRCRETLGVSIRVPLREPR